MHVVTAIIWANYMLSYMKREREKKSIIGRCVSGSRQQVSFHTTETAYNDLAW